MHARARQNIFVDFCSSWGQLDIDPDGRNLENSATASTRVSSMTDWLHTVQILWEFSEGSVYFAGTRMQCVNGLRCGSNLC